MKYLVNRETKEHVILDYNIMEACPPWEIVEADDEGWIKWEGGECPLPDGATYTTKSLKWREGFIIGIMDEPQTNYWGEDGDINAYRPILPAESKPEFKTSPEWQPIPSDDDLPRTVTAYMGGGNGVPPPMPCRDIFAELRSSVDIAARIPALIAEINEMLPDGYEVTRK